MNSSREAMINKKYDLLRDVDTNPSKCSGNLIWTAI